MRTAGPNGVRGLKPVSRREAASFIGLQGILALTELQNPGTVVSRPGTPIPGGRPAPDYDPIVAQYDHRAIAYEPPEPWFTDMPPALTPTPRPAELRAAEEPDPVRYEDSLLTEDMMSELLGAAPAVLWDDSVPTQPHFADNGAPLALILGHALECPPAGVVDTGADLHDVAQAIMEQQMDQVGAAQDVPLEDPCQMMQEMYDAHMDQLMNPGMMPDIGPAPGPM